LSLLIDVSRQLARSRMGAGLTRWLLVHMSSVLPVDRLYDSSGWMVFHHPQPSHAVHIQLNPKRSTRSLEEICMQEAGLLSELFKVVQKLVKQFNLQDNGYRLIANGGAYQDFLQVHFHLVSGEGRSS